MNLQTRVDYCQIAVVSWRTMLWSAMAPAWIPATSININSNILQVIVIAKNNRNFSNSNNNSISNNVSRRSWKIFYTFVDHRIRRWWPKKWHRVIRSSSTRVRSHRNSFRWRSFIRVFTRNIVFTITAVG